MEFSDPRPVDEGYAVSAALGPLKNDEVVLVVHRIIAKLRGNTWNQDESEKLIKAVEQFQEIYSRPRERMEVIFRQVVRTGTFDPHRLPMKRRTKPAQKS